MKNYTLHFIAIACSFSIGCFAQRSSAPDDIKLENAQLISGNMTDEELVVVAYHVEERINMTFGGRISTYNVSSLSLVNTNDLGPDNTRTVTPIYAKAKAKTKAVAITAAIAPAAMSKELPKASTDIVMGTPVIPIKEKPAAVEKSTIPAYIDVINTYERILLKGYRTVDMLKRVANCRFFEGDLTKSAKWYAELFDMTTDLDAEYYYRYAQSLKFIGKTQKANEMMKVFESKNL